MEHNEDLYPDNEDSSSIVTVKTYHYFTSYNSLDGPVITVQYLRDGILNELNIPKNKVRYKPDPLCDKPVITFFLEKNGSQEVEEAIITCKPELITFVKF